MMSSPRLLKYWVLIAVPAIALGCDDPVQPPQSGSSGPHEQVQLSYDRPDEIHFGQISQKAPTFGGYFYDEHEDLVAYVTDDGDRAMVRGEIESRFKQGRDRGPSQTASARVSFRRGQFTFRQLARWRDLASERMLGRHPLLVFVDMDESRNRVTLGVLPDETGHSRDDLRSGLEALGIPRAAMHFKITGRNEPSVGVPEMRRHGTPGARMAMMLDSYSTLQDNGSPFMGGLVIRPRGCTATVALDYNGSRHLATNSHCTNVLYEVDGIVLFQHDGVSRLGVETQDPLFSVYQGFRSRYSDGALALVDAGVPTRRGAIARPSARNGGGWSGGYGTLTINPTRSFFTVTQVEHGQVMYAEVQKVGQTTGWTYGAIIATCVDELGTDDGVRRCSTHATYLGLSGDSGAPVFRWFGGDVVTLMGLHWSHNDAGYSSYSGYQSLARELGGTLNPLTDITVSAPTGIYEQSYLSGGSTVYLQWNATPGNNSPYPSTYQVWRSRCEGYSYCTPEPWQQVATTTVPNWTDYSIYGKTYWGTTPQYTGWPYVAYYVKAVNMGVESGASWTVFFEMWP
jgi:hypothetical protein